MNKKSVCLLPKLQGPGGPSSFQAKLRQGLASLGIEAHHDPARADCGAILVIGGTRQLAALWQARRRGVRIVQRLDGINYIHKIINTGLRHFLRSEINNLQLATIRHYLSNHIVYQSHFAKEWWQKKYGDVKANNEVIYNGTNLQTFSPTGKLTRLDNCIHLVVVEASFEATHERDLKNVLEFADGLQKKTQQSLVLTIAGHVPQDLKMKVSDNENFEIRWIDLIPNKDIPQLNRSAQLLFSADINAGCPNSVIEALACGLPVVGYATGSLPELVSDDAGRVAPYGSDYWQLQAPNPDPLIEGALEILANQPHFCQAARARAEEHFGLELMTEKYLQALNL